MNERPKAVQKARRERRLGAALRENLKRRKAQAKGRRIVPAADDEAPRPTIPPELARISGRARPAPRARRGGRGLRLQQRALADRIGRARRNLGG